MKLVVFYLYFAKTKGLGPAFWRILSCIDYNDDINLSKKKEKKRKEKILILIFLIFFNFLKNFMVRNGHPG